jgi:hypothetical protein
MNEDFKIFFEPRREVYRVKKRIPGVNNPGWLDRGKQPDTWEWCTKYLFPEYPSRLFYGTEITREFDSRLEAEQWIVTQLPDKWEEIE